MKQRTYVVDDSSSLQDVLGRIAADPAYTSCSDCLVVVFEPRCEDAFLESLLAQACSALDKAKVCGMTVLGPVTPDTKTQSHTALSVIYLEDSTVHLLALPGSDIAGAAGSYSGLLDSLEHPKGVLCLTSNAQLDSTPFMEKVRSTHPDLPFFGAQAGTLMMGNDQSRVFCGSKVLDDHILTVTFCGAGLHIMTDYNLGWIALGKELVITDSVPGGLVRSINGEPATNIYSKYLDVEPDEWFYANVCEFPLLIKRGERLVSRVPIKFNLDGHMQFSIDMPVGTHCYLSYTKPEQLLRLTLESANAMAEFAPQATMLFACINRRVFMGNDRADKEFDYYRKANPELCWAYGHGEILYTAEGGGLLNSTMVAVSMREGDCPPDYYPTLFIDPDLTPQGLKIRPLADRLVTFLEATTAELIDTIAELETLAQNDQLTGIYNRRRTDEILEGALKGRRKGDQLALLMYDIDHFKRINDTYGHAQGDMVLRELTDRVSEAIRAGDILGRWGGEEFLVIVSDATAEQAEALAERIRAHVEEAPFTNVGKVTVSVGVTCAREGDDVQSIFGRADKALYEAKNSGRNRVSSYC